jgi:hypothetical protein
MISMKLAEGGVNRRALESYGFSDFWIPPTSYSTSNKAPFPLELGDLFAKLPSRKVTSDNDRPWSAQLS